MVRLDRHAMQRPLFEQVVRLLREAVMPALWRNALAGRAEVTLPAGSEREAALCEAEPAAVDMLLDVLADRGYCAVHTRRQRQRVVRVDLGTGEVVFEPQQPEHVLSVRFTPAMLRDADAGVVNARTRGDAVAAAHAEERDLTVRRQQQQRALLQKKEGKDGHGHGGRTKGSISTDDREGDVASMYESEAVWD